MTKLKPSEKRALRQPANPADFPRSLPPAMPFPDYLRSISSLPASMRPAKPKNFSGKFWKL